MPRSARIVGWITGLLCLVLVVRVGAASDLGGAGSGLWLLSYDAVPSAQVDLPEFHTAAYADVARFSEQVVDVLLASVATAAGIDPARLATEVSPGGYAGNTTASAQSELSGTGPDAELLAAAIGFVFRQYWIMVSDFGNPAGNAGYAAAHFPSGRLSPRLADRFYQHAAGVHDALGIGFSAFGDVMFFINLRDDDGRPHSGLEDAVFVNTLATAASLFEDIDVTVGAGGTADVRAVSNDWRTDPHGGAYIQRLRTVDSVSLPELALLQRRHTRLVEAAADRYGWR